eukprot:CAMPEP_0117517126 /NCGR_PEP_ID=MMETSP0784-20121206/31448_1 /TAXON_ID=39447 /ORGANISM="" /LENGTH=106 /DNA_ID=CAMNT_0005312991 /DNA_START=84 /DNA_END=404 /DNA_ORIENTATION=+
MAPLLARALASGALRRPLVRMPTGRLTSTTAVAAPVAALEKKVFFSDPETLGMDGFWGWCFNGFMGGCVLFTFLAHGEVGDHEGYSWAGGVNVKDGSVGGGHGHGH